MNGKINNQNMRLYALYGQIHPFNYDTNNPMLKDTVLTLLCDQKQPLEMFCKNKVFLEIQENSQENQGRSQEFLRAGEVSANQGTSFWQF